MPGRLPHGESLPHGSNARRHTRAALLAVGLSPTTTPREPATLDARPMHCDCAREYDGLLTLHGTRQHVPGRLPTVSHCPTPQSTTLNDAKHAGITLARRGPVAAHTRACHTRCSIDALRLRTSEMGCSRYMALGRTYQGACPRCAIAPRLKRTTPYTRAPLLAVGLLPTTTTREPATHTRWSRSMH